MKPTLTMKKTYLLLGITLLLVGGCETSVDIDFPSLAPRIVVNSFFAPGQRWEIHLSEALSTTEGIDAVRFIDNATAEILENDQVVTSLFHVGEGFYRSFSGHRPVVGTPSLRVSAPGYEGIEAVGTIPEPVLVTFTHEITRRSASSADLEVTIHLTDPPDQDNYYYIASVFSRFVNQGSTSTNHLSFHTEDAAILLESGDALGLNGPAEFGDVVFSDALFDGVSHEVVLEITTPLQDPSIFRGTLEVYLYSVSKTYYDYMTTYNVHEEVRGNPFAEPVQVHTNVQNGFGIFAGFIPYRLEIDL